MSVTEFEVPEVGQLVRARGQQWVVSALRRSAQPIDELAAGSIPGRTLVTLTSVSDDDLGDELTVVWEIEPGRQVLPSTALPEVTEGGWDDPEQLGAFLDAVRWGTVASADTRTLQAPFRAGIRIEEYQLEPVAKALEMPRVNLLIADDVGLGKTIEAGLIVQEMLLRHRARRVLVVCPASLTGKWAGEMADRFGLDFQLLDTQSLKDLRRSHGLEANPFTVFPRAIISMQWLRTLRIQRLLDEVLTPGTTFPGFFDLLIVDEAHHCAPPAPPRGKGYAVDSKQTQAVRRLGEHSQHRIFLSATPHNGYSESWQALLAMLDPQRFQRGVEPDPAVVRQVVVRRLKDSIVNADGTPRFPGRTTRAIEIAYTDGERQAHDLLERYAAARRNERGGATVVRANDLITLLLKKRLFSSPAAFAHTLAVHAQTSRRFSQSETTNPRAGTTRCGPPSRDRDDDPIPEWLEEALAWDDDPVADQDEDDAESDLLERVATLVPETDDTTLGLLDGLLRWADRHAEPEDTKAKALVEELEMICRPDGRWGHERVIVFTEYLDTVRWLSRILAARNLGGDRLGVLFGGMDERRRDHLKAAFQASPERDPVRILLATDAASEGIDLQNHCHRVINYDIPFNPNRLEQRIGRVDRLGQSEPVEVAHFVGAGWQDAPPGSYEDDLEFLSRVATKVAVERRDLGSVNPVLASAVEARMLGRPVLVDPIAVGPTPATSALRAEVDLRRQAARLRAQLDDSVRLLHVAPDNVRRVVTTALAMAGQPPLPDRPDGLVAPPPLRAGWEHTLVGLADPLSGEPRPLTFDPLIAENRDDVVLAHLGHPLVAQSTRFLRSAIWGGRVALNRVTGVRVELPPGVDIDGVLVVAFARLVAVGGEGTRLHEELILAGRELPDGGRSRRVELDASRYADLRRAVEAALEPGRCRLAPIGAQRRLAAVWTEVAPRLADDVGRRAEQQFEALSRSLQRRQGDEASRVRSVFEQLRATLSRALSGPVDTQLSFDDLTRVEQQQVERDRHAWQSRLDDLDSERDRELVRVERRFAGARQLVFPFAVVLCVPEPGPAGH
ncbi:MAG TPA: DISARM system SNF2-like helicase DrmD [Acidimicrobiales bacterium]|jgi:superfamily II DNA or RNA helicase|nr:DISARM system SNF2-like helicase DrmD [Acidimicrobiales bacterium]